MRLVARISLVGAVTAVIAATSFACSEADQDERWSELFMGVEPDSMPTITGPSGAEVATTWTCNVVSSVDEVRVSLLGKNGARFTFDLANPQEPTTFTTFTVRPYSSSPDAPSTGTMRIAFNDPDRNEPVAARGTVRLEDLDAPEKNESGQPSARFKITFDHLRLDMGSGSTRTAARPLASDGGFVQDESGGYALTGTLQAHALKRPPAGSSSSSSSSSSGGTKDCSKAWTCPNDGQATPMCQAACNYEGDARRQTCAVLKSMLDSSGMRCCSQYCP